MQVNKIAVIGSGVMGSGIAAQAANGGLKVLLMDIVPQDAKDSGKNRNQLAEQAIEKQLKTGGFAHADCADLVTAGNLEDDLNKLAEADWIIEVVIEKVEIKHNVYKQIDAVRKPGSIVSSNTSTIPLAELIAPMPKSFREDFMISHFFNPPRHMRLIEMVPAPKMNPARYQAICDVADKHLGKAVVHCKDTPGFIANRIGIYWMTLAMNKAFEHGMNVESADQLLGKPIGVPRTAVFGLYDLIGLDLMPLIASAMIDYVDDSDPFYQLNAKPDLLARMIDDGYTGRKGKGGFYKMEKTDGKKVMHVIDLSTGEYHPVMGTSPLASAKAKDISALLAASDLGGDYARDVMVRSLHYAASLLGEIADDIDSIDKAMRFGYSWKFGPFELIDQIGTNQFSTYCSALDLPVPDIIKRAGGGALYKDQQQLSPDGNYAPIPRPQGALRLSDQSKPLLQLAGGTLWDIGDNIVCAEITTKMHAINADVLDALDASLNHAIANAQALVIGSDATFFSAGANLHYFLEQAKSGELAEVEALLAQGQQLMQRLKYAPIPVVSALTGIALGGGCELLLHSTAVQAHLECRVGLVEVSVGLIPGWGGCTQMLMQRVAPLKDDAKIAMLVKCFADIVTANTAHCAFELGSIGLANVSDHTTMNVDRLLSDAKHTAQMLTQNHRPQVARSLTLPIGSHDALAAWLAAKEDLPPHTHTIAQQLMDVCALAEEKAVSEQDLLDKEREVFVRLLAEEKTHKRIEHMLASGKPLAN